MEPILQAHGLEKLYLSGTNRTQAVDGVSLSIYPGEKVAVTGPSGCGKTTLLSLLGLIVKPTHGEIVIKQKPLSLLSDRGRAGLRNSYFGYIVQDFALIEEASVYENIEVPLLYAKARLSRLQKRDRIAQVINSVGLSIKVDEKAKNLSGGQRQRVAIARAIVNNPQLILADEPTGALDSATGTEIFILLDKLVRDGKSLLLVTHDQQLADACDRRLHMKDGKLELSSE